METRPKFQQLVAHLRQAAAAFAEIATDRTSRRPRVGVVGEIYVRHHDFANQHLLRQLEALGAETTLASFCEWIFYLNANRKSDAQREWNVSQWLKNALQDRFKHRVLQRLSEPFEPLVGPLTEPPVAELLELADPYLHRTARGGDAIVSVGKAIELQRHGCHGVINVMPFSCMPSTIAAGIMKKLAADLAPMPLLSISYDGQQDPTLPTRLEAFLEQARACRNVSRSV
jgi:predicted nucleotide-binding protein (sugar kinase/HSP70/actin superfamily)